MASGKTFTVRRGQTAIPNATIYGSFSGLANEPGGDPKRLSIQALGLLLLLLSRPQGKASMGYRAFLDRGMGKTTVMRALRELDAAGLRHQFKRRAPSGKGVITDTVVSECVLSREEAEEIWSSEGHVELGKSGTSQEEPASQEAEEEADVDTSEPVDNSKISNGPDSGPNGSENGSTMVPISGPLKSGAQLSRESSKDSFVPTSQESELNQKATTADNFTTGEKPRHLEGFNPRHADAGQPLQGPPPGMTGKEWALSLVASSREKREREARKQERIREQFAAKAREMDALAASGGAFDGKDTPGGSAAWPSVGGGY